MFHKSRAIFLFLTIVAVVLVSAVGTTSVYADDGTPPPAETEVVDPPPAEGDVATEAAPTVEPVATEEPAEPVATEAPVEPAATEVPAEAAPAEEAPVVEEQLPAEPEAEAASILEQVPDDTTVTVLNAEGEAQPLSSQESVEAILTGDPVWCPATQLPGGTGCTQAFGSLGALLDFLDEHEADENTPYGQAGKIYVEMGTYAGGETSIDFNAYDFTTINNYDLTVQGAWVAPGVGIDPTNPTQFNIPITVGTSTKPWVGSLTFNNISISDVYNQTGLTLFSQGNITLFDVSVTGSQGGAELNAVGNVIVSDSKFNKNKKFGAKINAGDYVNVTGTEPQSEGELPNWTEFNNNGGNGLEVDSLSNVYVQWVKAEYNEGAGADINAAGFGAVLDSGFNWNKSYTYTYCGHKTATGGYGLKVVSASFGYLSGVTAHDNYLFGARVEAPDVQVYTSAFDHNGSGSISDPKGYGLEVISAGGATLDGVEANDNQKFGANIQATGYVEITNSFFNGNKSYKCSCSGTSYYGYGLQVVTSGDMLLVNVTASENYLWGAHLEGFDIQVRDSFFSNNGNGTKTLTGKGLEVISTSQVALSNVEANNNQLFGANIQAVGTVSIRTGFFNGQKFTYSSTCKGSVTTGGYGLKIFTTGDIALTLVQANDNYLYGAQLEGRDVAINGDSANAINSLFNNNGQYGLKIKSNASDPIEESGVALRNVEASNNKLFGADVEAILSVAVRDSFFNGNQSYTSTSCGHKTYSGYGLKVVTTADISLRNVTADQNYDFGAYLQGAGVGINIGFFSSNGTGTLSDHIGRGLEIVSTGSESVVNLSSVTASNNQLFGAKVTAEGQVFVNNSVFSGNMSYTGTTCSGKTYDGYGLKVVTTSDIQLGSVTAEKNYLWGASLQGANVTVANSVFSLNASPLQQGKTPTGRGLEVVSTGDVLLQSVTANENQLFGANVQADGKVEVVSSFFSKNKYTYSSSCQGTKTAGYGLKVVSMTTDPLLVGISLTNVQADENGAEGAILNGQSTVQVSGGEFNNNGASGLSITAQGNVTLNNITASGNKVDGVDVTGVCPNEALVTDGTFENNGKFGIKLTNILYTPFGTQIFNNNPSGNVSPSGCATTTITNASASTNASDSGSSQSDSGYSGGHHHSYGWHSWHWHRHQH